MCLLVAYGKNVWGFRVAIKGSRRRVCALDSDGAFCMRDSTPPQAFLDA